VSARCCRGSPRPSASTPPDIRGRKPGQEPIDRRERTVGTKIASAVGAILAKLAARERAREPIVVIEVDGESRASTTIAQMASKGYILDDTEPTTRGSTLLRFRAND
jgi:hypothetical protein